jgi:hypothetical protein
LYNIVGANPAADSCDYIAYKVIMNACFNRISELIDEFEKSDEPLPSKRQRIFGVKQSEES